MNPLSGIQWLVAGGALLLLAAAGLSLHHKGVVSGRAEIQGSWNTYKVEQGLVVAKQLKDVTDELLRQQDLNKKAETNYAKLQGDYAGLAQRLDRSLRDYAATRDASRHTLPATTADPTQPADAATSASSVGEAAELAGLTSAAVTACYADAAQLRALLDTLN